MTEHHCGHAEVLAAVRRIQADLPGFMLDRVRTGEPNARAELLRYAFGEYVETGRPVDARILQFIWNDVRQVLNGEDPRKFFPAGRPRGRRATNDPAELLYVARGVILLVGSGKSESEAIALMAKLRGWPEGRVKHALGEFRHAAWHQVSEVVAAVTERVKHGETEAGARKAVATYLGWPEPRIRDAIRAVAKHRLTHRGMTGAHCGTSRPFYPRRRVAAQRNWGGQINR